MKKRILSLVVFATMAVSVSAQKITLKLAQGQKITSVASTTTTISFEVMGQSQEQNMTIAATTTYDIKSVAVDEIVCEQTITKVKTAVSAMGREMEYDSEKNNNDSELAGEVAKTLNKPTTIKANSKGEEIKDATAKEKKEKSGLNLLTSGETGLNSFILPSLFDQEIKQGTTWTAINEQKGTVTIKTVNNYTIDKIENDIIYVSNNAVQKLDGVMEQMGMELPMSGTNTIKSTMEIDAKTGIIKKASSEINGTTNISAQGMEIPMTTKAVVSVQNQ